MLRYGAFLWVLLVVCGGCRAGGIHMDGDMIKVGD